MNNITMKIILDEIKCTRRKNSGVLEIDDEKMIDDIEAAIERQVPKLVDTIPGDYTSDYICTVCGETTRFEHQKYCVECGQRLEW